MKKILHITESMGGGVLSFLIDQTNALADKYEIYIAYAVREQTPKNLSSFFDKRIHLIKVKNFQRSVNPVKDLKAFAEIRRIAEKVKPDIIHLHSSKAGAVGRLAFNGKKIPVFYNPHGYSFLMKDQSKAKCMIYKTIEWLCGLRKCTTICCSNGEYLESKPISRRSVCVNNGINISSLQEILEKQPQPSEHPFTVFTLGRISYQKNPVLFNQIAEKMPDVNFVWIGDGELREELKAPNISITGWVNREQALAYSIPCDAFLLTSLWEGLPLSLLEAMYMKKVCIVSDVIGNHDVITTGVNGLVCNSADDFVNAIRKAQNDSKCKQMIKNARNDVENEYCTDVMVRKYRSIYEKALRKNMIIKK